MNAPSIIAREFHRPHDVRLVKYLEIGLTRTELNELQDAGVVSQLDDDIWFLEDPYTSKEDLPDWVYYLVLQADAMDIEEVRFYTEYPNE